MSEREREREKERGREREKWCKDLIQRLEIHATMHKVLHSIMVAFERNLNSF